jgi:hypothetical protein
MSAETWTQDDIDNLKAAIASGVLSVRYAGPPERSVTYHNLTEMRRLLASMVRQVCKTPRARVATHTKGVR